MLKCEECGREVILTSGCCCCRKAFCSEHVRPVNHRCARLYRELKYWCQKPKDLERKIQTFKKLGYPIITICVISIVLSAVTIHTSSPAIIELRDPTYQEALQFIKSDQTDKNLYRKREYTCANFATDFRNNALKAGYRCGYVLVFFVDCSHALNCFNTTDKGFVFVEPQEDEIIKLTIGQPYWTGTRLGSYNDTVMSFLITW